MGLLPCNSGWGLEALLRTKCFVFITITLKRRSLRCGCTANLSKSGSLHDRKSCCKLLGSSCYKKAEHYFKTCLVRD